MKLYVNFFSATLFCFLMNAPLYCIDKSITQNEDEQEFIADVHKKLTKRGFNSVQMCTEFPEKCDSPILAIILNGSEWKKQELILGLKAQFIWLNNDQAQKRFAYQMLCPWVTPECIEEIFEKHSSSTARANAFTNTLIPLVKKLSKMFLMKK